MKIVVDTNIVFSAILNSSGNIGKILIHYGRHFELYSCDFLKDKIASHQKKLLKLTKLDRPELDELISLTTKHIHFINEGIIPRKDWNHALGLTESIDKHSFHRLGQSFKGKFVDRGQAVSEGSSATRL